MAFRPGSPVQPATPGDWLKASFLLLAVFLIYQPVWYAGYVWDDDAVFTNNPCIVGPLGLKEIWTTSAADICPLVLTTFWAEHSLWGLAPLPYHLVNVFLHGASGVVLWLALRALRIPGAWWGAALWAVHPVQVESVAWVTELKNTESGLFFLLAILFFIRWVRTTELDPSAGARWSISLTWLFAAMAIASKSSTVILPVTLCLCAWWMEHGLRWRRLVATGPIFLMSLAGAIATMWTQSLNLAADPIAPRSWPERVAEAGAAVWFYLGKLLWPHPVIAVYPRREWDASHWISYVPLLVALAALLLFWLKSASWSRGWFFAFAFFLVALLPGIGFFDNTIFRYSLVYDHFQYLASMGPLALVGAGLAAVMARVPRHRRLLISANAGLLIILMFLTWQHAWAYESSETLWTDTVAKNPGCWVAQNNLGHCLESRGLVRDAAIRYETALKINPDYPTAHDNLGELLLNLGATDAAIAQFQQALEVAPNFPGAHSNLGLALLRKGRTDEALVHLRKALELQPDFAAAHNNLGQVLLQKRQLDEAIVQFQSALALSPNLAETHKNLGVALFQQGKTDLAIAQFQEAIQLAPNAGDAPGNLAKVQALLRNKAK